MIVNNPSLLNRDNYLASFRKTLQEARKNGSQSNVSEALAELGAALFKVEDFENGAEQFDLAISLARQAGDTAMEARHIGSKGLCLAEAKDFAPAAECFKRVQTLAKQLDDQKLECDALGNLGLVLADTGEAGPAMSYLLEAVRIAESLSDRWREMVQVGNLGNVQLLIADLDNALTSFEKAFRLSRKLNDRYSEAGYLANLGALAVLRHDHKKTVSIFSEVVSITTELGDEPGKLNALNQINKAHAAMINQKKERLCTHNKQDFSVRNIAISNRDNSEAVDANAVTFSQVGDSRGTLDKFDDPRISDADKQCRFELLNNQAGVYFERGEYTLACQSWEQALALNQKADGQQNLLNKARVMGHLAGAYGELGDLEQSISYSRKALSLARAIEDRRTVGEQQISLAFAYRERSHPAKAMEYCRAAMRSFAEVGLFEFEEKARRFYGELKDDLAG